MKAKAPGGGNKHIKRKGGKREYTEAQEVRSIDGRKLPKEEKF